MKEYALELARSQKTKEDKVNVLREYLQAYILRILHDEGFFRGNAFVGGTALRFLHELPRYSEDLDFSKAGDRDAGPVFSKVMKKVKDELKAAAYQADVAFNEDKTVQNGFIKFQSLLYEAEISPLKSQNLSVKIEIDTNPPSGAELKSELITKYFPISYLTYEVPSLLAGKIHALLSRKYTKGRDFFDLGWYLSRWRDLTPNFELLKNALIQTGWKGQMPDASNWLSLIREVVEKSDWDVVRKDVTRFLQNPKDADIFSKENILGLIQKRSV
jgi:predicted nucleotidyltransferase component of viral defense system